MSLSATKLKELVSSHGFEIKNYFTENKCCFYLDVIHSQTYDNFLIYIPCKYNIQLDGYELNYIHVEDFNNITNEFTGKDKQNLEKVYGDMKIELLNTNDDIQKQLEDRYKHEIAFPEIPKDDNLELKAIYRQINRLKYSVENLQYKIGILYKNYLCSIRRNGMIDFFKILKYPSNPKKQLLVIIDLETFFDKHDTILKEIKIIRTNLYNILGKTQTSNIKIIQSMIESKELQSLASFFSKKTNVYDQMLLELEEILNSISIIQERKFNDIKKIGDTVHNDVSRINAQTQLQKEIQTLEISKQDARKNIDIIRRKKENSMLDIDKIIFDNTVMYDCIVKNFLKLRDFYK